MTGPVTGPVSRPLIGITAYREPARWTVWHEPAVLLPDAYVRVVVAAGGVPVLLPPEPDLVASAVERLDGVVLAGGADVDPARYGAHPDPATAPPRADRDAAELEVVAAAAAADLPLLGVCRGLQLLNVARGGTLVQHLPDVLGSARHAPAAGEYGRTPVRLEPASRTAGWLAAPDARLEVSCYHHQAIDTLGAGLRVTARAADGTIEAVEDDGAGFLVAVQWHPEVDGDPRLFAALVAAARDQGAARVRRAPVNQAARDQGAARVRRAPVNQAARDRRPDDDVRPSAAG
jgi:gamma-glutamyl-gamma-aminobutyrate hydrolase PuuD